MNRSFTVEWSASEHVGVTTFLIRERSDWIREQLSAGSEYVYPG